MKNSPTSIAIVGSGPSGCYTAQFLQKKWPSTEIVIFESLPVPYGLVRYGIAADHQGSKTVIEQFDRLFNKSNVHLRANVTVGKHISFQKLRDSFDITVLATGLNFDVPLPIPVSKNTKVMGAGAIMKYFNGHPDAHHPSPIDYQLGKDVTIVGMGNVAVDVARLILKTEKMLDTSDIDDNARYILDTAGVRSISIINRAAARDAKCDVSMLSELIELSNVDVSIIGLDPDEGGPVPELLQSISQDSNLERHDDIQLNIFFNTKPEQLYFIDDRNCLKVKNTKSGNETFISSDTVITAIGFINGPMNDHSIPSASLEGSDLYRVGWLSRGSKGTVAENRKDAKFLSEKLVKDVESGLLNLGKSGLQSIEHDLPATYVDYHDWKRIDAHEIYTAAPNRCRKKIVDRIEMLRIAHCLNASAGSSQQAKL